MTATFVQPDRTTQSGSAYPANIDAAVAVLAAMAAQFSAHAQAAPNMTVRVDAGILVSGATVTTVASQNTATITAPVTNPRIDRIVINSTSGAVSVITGTEAASPSPPALTAGKIPIARVALATSTTQITNALITDERAWNSVTSNGDNVFSGTNSLTAASTIGGKAGSDIVTGPASATADAVALFNGTGGKTLKNGPGYSSGAGVASSLVQRNASGFIFNNYYNMTADDQGTAVPSRLPIETGTDGYLRWQTWANFKGNVLASATGTATYVQGVSAPVIAHGLGVVPHDFSVHLECIQANNGYSVGNLIQFASNNDRLSIAADATNIVMVVNSALVCYHKTSSATFGPTGTDWRWRMYARA